MTETSMSCPKCGGVAQHAEWCRDVSTMPGDEREAVADPITVGYLSGMGWPSDTYDTGEPYPEDVPPHDEPGDQREGPEPACGGPSVRRGVEPWPGIP